MSPAFEPLYLSPSRSDASRRFCIWHPPQPGQGLRGPVVHVHAFAEEMNKSRRMVAQQARALAASGFGVLQLDLFGCGDSDGEFGQARWPIWLADVAAACEAADARWQVATGGTAAAERWLWGHRLGALLAAQAATQAGPAPWNLLLWQPVLNGKAHLQQFLRLDAAASMLGKSRPPGHPGARERLNQGEPVEVAGYGIHPALAEAIDAVRLKPPPASVRVAWLDVAPQPAAAAAPATQLALDAWRAAGCDVRHAGVTGPAFWQTTEIEDAPQLLPATAAAMAA
jgi:uncharacterized protein